MRKKRATAPAPVAARARAFDGVTPTSKPCPVCLDLSERECIQPRAVMPLPPFPARSRTTNAQLCHDCQATEAAMRLWGIHPDFVAARLCVANERCESLTMQFGMAEHFGMCKEGIVRPASLDDLEAHLAWLRRNGIAEHA